MKIAMVIQRFGESVNGGAETYCRELALHLKESHDIEVITTTAEDYTTWAPYFEKGIEEYKGIIIRRFNTDFSRDHKTFGPLTQKILNKTGLTKEIEFEWVRQQGPFSSEMFLYLKENHYKYESIIFCTYLYAQSVFGPKFVPREKTILISMAHDENWIRLSIFKEVFEYINKIIYLTEEEKRFIEKKFSGVTRKSTVAGTGINTLEKVNELKFKQKHKLDKYILYAGRIDPSKGCDHLIKYFLRYIKESHSDLQLALMGKTYMKIPTSKQIKNLGFVSEEEKFAGMKGAVAFVLPSQFESLSISTLESMSVGTSVIVNEKSEVLKGHCLKSNAGLYYSDYYEFKECLDFFYNKDEDVKNMAKNAMEYVKKNYTWEKCIDRINNLINKME